MTESEWEFSPGMAAVHGLAVLFCLGMAIWGLFADCRPHDTDGQCGMSLVFAQIIGLAGAFVLVAGSCVFLGLVGHVPSRPQRRFWAAWTAAGLAGISALCIAAVIVLALTPEERLGEVLLHSPSLWFLTTLLGGPYAYMIVFVVAAASDLRARRMGGVSAGWACSAGAVAGMILGAILSVHLAYSVLERASIATGGVWAGAVIGWVFWRVGLRGRRHIEAVAQKAPASNAI